MRAFDADLQPVLQEVGIDRFDLSVAGQWVTEASGPEGVNADDYFEMLHPPEAPMWFRRERTIDGVKLVTRSQAACTVGHLELVIKRKQQRPGGTIWLKLEGGNVTRTLHHLLIMHGHLGEGFLAYVSDLEPAAFFERAPGGVPLAHGQNADNWISDYGTMRACLGGDPFGSFFPVYVRQLQALVGALVVPHYAVQVTRSGSSLCYSLPGLNCRMDWDAVRFQQIEAYFERRHTSARGAVRLLATAALNDLDQADVWRYMTNSSMWAERQADNLIVGLALREHYKLKVYAKASARIRFEVRRKGRGTTIHRTERLPSPDNRMLDVFEHERQNLLNAAQWRALGPMLDDHPAPQQSDLVHLCSEVHRVSLAHQVSFSTLLAVLMEDGGIRPNGQHDWSEALVADLVTAGVLHRPIVRRRDHRHPHKRYALRPEFRALTILISQAIAEGRGLLANRSQRP